MHITSKKFIFNLESDEPNKGVIQHLTTHDIYAAVTSAYALLFML